MATEGFKRKLTAILRTDPNFSIEYYAKTYPIKNQADRERLIGALRKAGLMWFENILTQLTELVYKSYKLI